MRIWRVRDVMTKDVVTVEESTPYRDIVDILAEHRISAVPVVDKFRRVVGVVSEADLLHKVEFAGEPRVRRFFETRRQRGARSKARGDVAGDLMAHPAVTTMPDTALAVAARLMDSEQVKRLPVTDDLGGIVGIVSRRDVLRVFQRTDEEIRVDIAEEVLRRSLWVEPAAVQVSVDAGVVTLAGRLETKSLVQLAERLTEGVAGVVEVVNQLDYDFDDTAPAASRTYRSHPFNAP